MPLSSAQQVHYRFTPDRDWSDFSSGRVLRGKPGQTAFPARLANEMFHICAALCERQRRCGPYTIYDPCCGAATLLTTIGLLNPHQIQRLVGSDIDPGALTTARHNLALLSFEGINQRLLQIKTDFEAYRKPSHNAALESAYRLRELERPPLATALFELDATRLSPTDIHAIGQPDIVLCDLPYGIQSHWTVPSGTPCAPAFLLLSSLLLLPNKPVIAIAADKKTRLQHPQYRRLEKLSVGKRQIVFLMAI